jgi:hypothetical protein
MVQVEAIHTRWVNDIGKFLEAADAAVYGDPTKTPNPGFGRSIAAEMKDDERFEDEAQNKRLRPKPVEGGGWVVEIRGFTDHQEGRTFVHKALLRNLQRMDSFAKDEGKIARFIVGVQDPVKGKVSHAFIFNVWKVENALPNAFQYINVSYLDKMMPEGAASSGQGSGTPPGGMAGPGTTGAGAGGTPPGGTTGATTTAPFGPAWTGLTSRSSGGGIGGDFRGTSTGGGGSMTLPPTAGGGGGTTTGKEADGNGRRRYEFVVMMVWREPVPNIIPSGDTAAPAPTGSPGGTGSAAGRPGQ